MSSANGHSSSDYEWLNQKLFEPVFEKELNRDKTDFDIKIKSIKPAVANGDNYFSEVMRVQIEIALKNEAVNTTTKIYNLIIKASIAQMAELEDMQVFEKEMEYYNNVAPKVAALDKSFHFSPKCYWVAAIGTKQIIIVDDMSAQGYKMADRLVGLDLEHCKLYFRKIAEFHALTATYYERNQLASCFEKANYTEDKRAFHKKWTDISFQTFLGIFKEHDSLKQYAEVVKTWDNCAIFDTAQEVAKVNPNDFNVLNHGDSWVNNILFQYDENNNPIDMRMIDFQLSNYGSPIVDIFLFFMSSPNLEVREKHFDELIQMYHTNLVAHLKEYKYSKVIPTLRELHIEIVKKGFLGSSYLIGYVPIILLDPDNAVPFDKLLEDSEYGEQVRQNFFHNPRYIRTLEVVMKFLRHRGFLNV